MYRLTSTFRKIHCDTETPISLFTQMAGSAEYAFLLESAEVNSSDGRFSFIGFEPLKLFVFPVGGVENPLEVLRQAFAEILYDVNPELPSFQAGFVGYFSYELVRHFEKISLSQEHATIPEGIFFLPRKLLIFDHVEQSLTFVAYEKEDFDELVRDFANLQNVSRASVSFVDSRRQDVAEMTSVPFENLVFIAQEKICAGEIFQVVLSQKFERSTDILPFDLYRKLRVSSPSPYMYYLQYPDFSIVGSSPETLVKAQKRELTLRPIAGTRVRGQTPEEDEKLAAELLADPKECAEHVMLVDLGRNDLGRVAESGTVAVSVYMRVQKYKYVMHLVSEICAKQSNDVDLFDVFRSAFPAGTLTGAPKVRAMEIIAELETEPREIYGGAVGYFDLSGDMDFAIAIRTMLYKDGLVRVRAGAGIVYDSVPAHEHAECLNKAKGPLTVLDI